MLSTEERKRKRISSGLLTGLILASLEQTIIAAAMPTVARQLGDFALYSWVFSSYMLASTTVMPIYGKLADVFGRKIMYLIGLLIFIAGSLLCGLAGSMAELIAFRAIQGVGAGALLPLSFTIVADLYPAEQRAKFMALFSASFAGASICGPALGGVLAERDWSWIFFINVPIGLAAFFILAEALENKRRPGATPAYDWWGTAAFAGGSVALLSALVMGGRELAWISRPIIGLLLGGALLLLAFLWIETKAKEPLIPLRLFKNRIIATTSIVAFFISAGMFGAVAYIPLFVQRVIDVSPSIAGYILVPLMLATIVTTVGSRRWMMKVPYRTILAPSVALTLIGFLFFSRLDANTPAWQIVLCMIVTGLGLGAVFPTVGTAAQHAVSRNQLGVATSANQFFRSVGGAFGVAVMGGMLSDQEALTTAVGEVFLLGAVFVGISLAATFALGRAALTQSSE